MIHPQLGFNGLNREEQILGFQRAQIEGLTCDQQIMGIRPIVSKPRIDGLDWGYIYRTGNDRFYHKI